MARRAVTRREQLARDDERRCIWPEVEEEPGEAEEGEHRLAPRGQPEERRVLGCGVDATFGYGVREQDA